MQPTLAQVIEAIDAAIAGGADAWQPPEGWEPGDPDGCWDHPAAAQARALTLAAGITWDFTNWAEARHSVAAWFEAQGVECAYCGADACPTEVPALGDDAAWTELARVHHGGCEWIETRAHRRAAEE